jgi:hypothetical protein
MIHQKGEGFPAILQPFDVSDEPASLDGKGKLLRRAFIPALKDLFFGEAIKRDIQFNRFKIFCVEFEPFSLGKIGWVKDPVPPMGVIIAACADEDHKLRVQGFEGSWVQGFILQDFH